MSELGDLVTVFGRIDDAVVEDPSLESKVAAMLPPYRHGAAGWFRALHEYQRSDNPQLIDLADPEAAFRNLARGPEPRPDLPENQNRATTHWLNARRLLAATTLSGIRGSINLDLPADADPQGLVNHLAQDQSAAQQLHSHLRQRRNYPTIETWPVMMADLRDRNVVKPEYELATYVPPIAFEPGSFRVVRSPTRGTSVALRTHHHLTQLDLGQARQCLIPDEWAYYKPPWCRMDFLYETPDGYRRFREVVAADCGGPSLSTVLDFRNHPVRFVDEPEDGEILEYRLPSGPPIEAEGADGQVTIDEGTLEVRPATPRGQGVHFISTKRIQYAAFRELPTMTAAGLAFLTWVLGWDTLAERFVYFFAEEHGQVGLVTPAQGTTDPEAPPTIPPTVPGDGTVASVLMLGVAGWESRVRQCVGSVRSSANRAAAGYYGWSDYLGDMSSLSNEVADVTTMAASLGAQLWRSATASGGSGAGVGGAPTPGPSVAASHVVLRRSP